MFIHHPSAFCITIASVALLLSPGACFATNQILDECVFEGNERTIQQNPLSALWWDDKGKFKSPGFDVPSTANWKGYEASWEIKDQKLYLKSFTAARGGTQVEVSELVPGGSLPLHATFYSGQIHFPLGKPVGDPPVFGRPLKFSTVIVFEIEQGKVTKMTLEPNFRVVDTWNGLVNDAPTPGPLAPISTSATIRAPKGVRAGKIDGLTKILRVHGLNDLTIDVADYSFDSIVVEIDFAPSVGQARAVQLYDELLDFDGSIQLDGPPTAQKPQQTKRPERLDAFDPMQPFRLELGRGSGLNGLNTTVIHPDGRVVMHRLGSLGPEGVSSDTTYWYECQFQLPPQAIQTLAKEVARLKIPRLDKEYSANIVDGGQWIVRLEQDGKSRSIYMNNTFPRQAQDLASFVDALVVRHGGRLVWTEVSARNGRNHEEDLWESIRD